ncbi:MAG TPA: glycosyltransferase family 4 protein [Sediminispirochaeta sp.]|nr:glycosyltransferase family 4 protein [Sediminispirochaeta sp.]
MKVLVISHMYPSSFNEVAGIFVHEQVKVLVAKGVEVRVISPVPWTPFPIKHLRKKWKRQSQVPQQAQWDGVKVAYPRYLAFPRAWLFATSGKRMYRGIKKLVQSIHREFPFELVHAHVALPGGYAGALVARDMQVPMVVTIHGQDLQHTVHRSVRCQRALAFALNHASRVIVVSHKLKRLAEEHFGCRDKLAVIPNGVDPQKVTVPNLGDLPDRARSWILLSVSNLVHTKGLDLNLVAVQRLRKRYPLLRYRVIGGGPLEGKLRRMAASLKLDDCVEFLGRQPHHQVMEHMAMCDIFSLPSWQEGFGVVYLEAMASGKPVIGCEGEGIEDFVEHGKTGLLVKPRDVDSLVEALDFLLSHPEEARAMGERARKLVLENYNWEKTAEKTIAVYKEVLGER